MGSDEVRSPMVGSLSFVPFNIDVLYLSEPCFVKEQQETSQF